MSGSTREVAEQRRSYRKGMVLGLTLAEVALLLVFVLLMLLATSFAGRKNDIHELVELRQYKQKNPPEKITALLEAEASLRSIQEALGAAELPPDDFKKLVTVVAQSVRNNQDVVAAVVKLVEETRAAKQALSDAINALKLAGTGDPKAVADKIAALTSRAANLDGQIKQLQAMLKDAGAGLVYPSCWNVEGAVEYVFDVELAGQGLRMRDHPETSRASERAQLGLRRLPNAEVFSPEEFYALTRKAYLWSVDNNCRFYVTVYDGTGESEKKLYKDLLKAVENHFYKRALNDAAPF